MKTDLVIFEVWPKFVATGNMLSRFETNHNPSGADSDLMSEGVGLIRKGKDLIQWIAFARVPMPVTTRNYIESCDAYISKMKTSIVVD